MLVIMLQLWSTETHLLHETLWPHTFYFMPDTKETRLQAVSNGFTPLLLLNHGYVEYMTFLIHRMSLYCLTRTSGPDGQLSIGRSTLNETLKMQTLTLPVAHSEVNLYRIWATPMACWSFKMIDEKCHWQPFAVYHIIDLFRNNFSPSG